MTQEVTKNTTRVDDQILGLPGLGPSKYKTNYITHVSTYHFLMAPTFVFPLPAHPNNQALNSETFKVPPIDGTLVGGEIFDWQCRNSPEHHALEYLDEDGKLIVIKWGRSWRCHT